MLAFVIDHWFLFLALLVVLALLVLQPALEGAAGGARVTSQEAVRLMNRESAVVLDVREPTEFQSGHINRALNIPLGQVAGRIPELKKFQERPIIVYCATGARSARAAAILHKQGFAGARNLTGGITAWRNSNLPIES